MTAEKLQPDFTLMNAVAPVLENRMNLLSIWAQKKGERARRSPFFYFLQGWGFCSFFFFCSGVGFAAGFEAGCAAG
jgi:hypothetical protein